MVEMFGDCALYTVYLEAVIMLGSHGLSAHEGGMI